MNKYFISAGVVGPDDVEDYGIQMELTGEVVAQLSGARAAWLAAIEAHPVCAVVVPVPKGSVRIVNRIPAFLGIGRDWKRPSEPEIWRSPLGVQTEEADPVFAHCTGISFILVTYGHNGVRVESHSCSLDTICGKLPPTRRKV